MNRQHEISGFKGKRIRNLGLVVLLLAPLTGCGKLDDQRATASLKHGLAPQQAPATRAAEVVKKSSNQSPQSPTNQQPPASTNEIPPAWRAPKWTPPPTRPSPGGAGTKENTAPKEQKPKPEEKKVAKKEEAKTKKTEPAKPVKNQPEPPKKPEVAKTEKPKMLPQRPVPMGPLPKRPVPAPSSPKSNPGSAQAGDRLTPPVWGTSPVVQPWTSAVLKVVRARLRDFDAAQDVGDFCPGYQNASEAERVNCWLVLVSAVAKFESNFETRKKFRESSGQDSIGLLALSPGECSNAPTAKQLAEPVPNLICGTNLMAKLIRENGYIDGRRHNRGGATQYWSTLRSQYTYYYKVTRQNLILGHKTEIIAYTKRYRDRPKSDGLVKKAMWTIQGESGLQVAWIEEAAIYEDNVREL